MKTTLDFDDILLKKAKAKAAIKGETLTRIIEMALVEYLKENPKPSQKFKLNLLTKNGKSAHGLNLEDRDSLYEFMERLV